MKQYIQFGIIAVGAVAVCFSAYKFFAPAADETPGEASQPSPEALMEIINSSAGDIAKIDAVHQLGNIGLKAGPYLRPLINSNQSAPVRAAVLEMIGKIQDFASGEEVLKAMDDPAPTVRGRAGVAMARVLGTDWGFKADDPPERRKKMIEMEHKDWEMRKAAHEKHPEKRS